MWQICGYPITLNISNFYLKLSQTSEPKAGLTKRFPNGLMSRISSPQGESNSFLLASSVSSRKRRLAMNASTEHSNQRSIKQILKSRTLTPLTSIRLSAHNLAVVRFSEGGSRVSKLIELLGFNNCGWRALNYFANFIIGQSSFWKVFED